MRSSNKVGGIVKEELELKSEDLPKKTVIDITGVKQLKTEYTGGWNAHYGFANITVK